MIKRIVVGLDPSEYSRAALELACARAKDNDATVIGVGVVDLPSIEDTASGAGVGASHFAKKTLDRHLADARAKVDDLLAAFEATCEAAGVNHRAVRAEGTPADEIGAAGMSADLIVVGIRTFFHFNTQQEAGDTLQELLKDRACPVLAVPAPLELPWRCTVLPHDGSLMATRATRAFVSIAAGLPVSRKVLLLRVDDDQAAGDKLADPAAYLAAHGFDVETRVEPGDAPEVVLAVAADEQPALTVLGPSGKGSLRTWLFGSVTRALVDDGSIPLFVAG